MRTWKNVSMPDRMLGLDRDPRGYPIPYIILRDKNGKVHFQINDSSLVYDCIRNLKCAICGEELNGDYWLAGGPLSALHPMGAYIDTPLHKECGTYAMQVCPYLAVSIYSKRLDASTINDENFEGMVFIDPTMMAARPPFFIFCKTETFTVSIDSRYIHPVRPLQEVQYWKDEETISGEQAAELFKNYNAK